MIPTTPREAQRELLRQVALEVSGPTVGWLDAATGQPMAASLPAFPPDGRPLSLPASFSTWDEARGPWVIGDAGECEVLVSSGPISRYGVGVLFPDSTGFDDLVLSEPQGEDLPGDEVTTEELSGPTTHGPILEEPDEAIDASQGSIGAALVGAAGRAQSTMGISFLLDRRTLDAADGALMCELHGARYDRLDVEVEGKQRTWWRQVPIVARAEVPVPKTLASPREYRTWDMALTVGQGSQGGGPLSLVCAVLWRKFGESHYLVTVSVRNLTQVHGGSADRPSRDHRARDAAAVFQSNFGAWVEVEEGVVSAIAPYPGARPASSSDGEELLAQLQYLDKPIFGVGHGCAADWRSDPQDSNERATHAFGVSLPIIDLPGVSSEVRDHETEQMLQIPMSGLAGLEQTTWDADISRLLKGYESWIQRQGTELPGLADRLAQQVGNHLAGNAVRAAGQAQLDRCREALARMRGGVDYLRSQTLALRAFQLANLAVLLMQHNGKREVRQWSANDSYPAPQPLPLSSIDSLRSEGSIGHWRAFQIGFILMALQGIAEEKSGERAVVDVLWFPTGGGKTEAYLGLVAFNLFLARLSNPESSGVSVITRYTLRLLTTQQFQRAARLIGAMEAIRIRDEKSLGKTPFSIGFLAGGAASPNSHEEALKVFTRIQEEGGELLLDRCPYCSAFIGAVKLGGRATTKYEIQGQRVAGSGTNKRVIFFCPDQGCPLYAAGALPVYEVDTDVFEHRPSLVVGTVDKFALMAWMPDFKRLFGLCDRAGTVVRDVAPPSLIIQDELHLIAGPLGSTVALYETAIAELCRHQVEGVEVVPKIIASSATLTGYREQVLALFGREDAALFPPNGLRSSDSYFAHTSTDGTLGKTFVGIFANGHSSGQTTQVRTFAAMLQGISTSSLPAGDPYWTNLVYFNNKAELGFAQSLLGWDVPDYLRSVRGRRGINFGTTDWRDVEGSRVLELTGDHERSEVQAAFRRLAIGAASGAAAAADICLATNIIEVGVDVPRLALMSLVGQPSSVASYIQATGRVGRQWQVQDTPGLVFAVYGVTKSRDQSYYERFRSFHERLYASVEPVSITPFAAPLLENVAHAVALALLRLGRLSAATDPAGVSDEDWNWAVSVLDRKRLLLLANGSGDDLARVLADRREEWKRWAPSTWMYKYQPPSKTGQPPPPSAPLGRKAGDYVPQEVADRSWPLPMSMRSVEPHCEPEVPQTVARDMGVAL